MRAFAAASLLVAAVQAAAPSGCAPVAKACDLSFQGIYVDAGEVWDVVTPTCDKPPIEHEIEAWMEYKRVGEYSPLARRHAYSWITPDKLGFPLKVSSGICVEGWYRAKAHVTGRGPATEQNPRGIPFEFEDTGRSKYVTAEQCSGGG